MNKENVRLNRNNYSNTLSFICISTIAWLYIQYEEVTPYMDEVTYYHAIHRLMI